MSPFKNEETLPEDLLWEEGHASELALSAFGDGEAALLSAAVQAHIAECTQCTAHVGGAALLSMQTSRAVNELGPLLRITPVPVAARKKLPMPMLGLALVIGLVGALPTLLGLPGRVAELSVALLQMLPTLSRGSLHLLRNGLGPAWVVATCTCAVLLVMASVAVTRLLPKPVSR